MQKTYNFDMVFDTIIVNRKLMNCFSHPMKKENMLEGIGNFASEHDDFLVIAATLLDNEVSFFVERNTGLEDKITEITLSKYAALEDADYIFIPSTINYVTLDEIFGKAKSGTYEDPHSSATIIIRAPDDIFIKKTIEILKKQNIEYPLGIDLIFMMENGDMLAIPRLIKEVG